MISDAEICDFLLNSNDDDTPIDSSSRSRPHSSDGSRVRRRKDQDSVSRKLCKSESYNLVITNIIIASLECFSSTAFGAKRYSLN